MSTVDIHTPLSAAHLAGSRRALWHTDWPWLRHTGAGRAMLMIVSGNFARHVRLLGPGGCASRQDRDGVDVQIMCVTPALFAYQRPAAQGSSGARLFNNAPARSAHHVRGG